MGSTIIDVYKRQVIDRIDGDYNIQAFEIRPEGAGHSDMDDSIHSERLNQSIGADCSIDPVSYTHLDVYKRQRCRSGLTASPSLCEKS